METEKIEIVSRWDKDKVLYRSENAQNVRAAVVEARREGVNLGAANLRGANLRDANLRGSDLSGANLRGANLRDADLSAANLASANLRGANLRDVNLSGANLSGANLRDADLWGANLRGSDLRGANLRGANLRDADLPGANLSGANLRDAVGAPIMIHGLPSGPALLSLTDEGWQVRVGCWSGTPDELEALTEGDEWPEAEGDERELRRPGLAALVALCRAHIAYVEATAPADEPARVGGDQ